ncbi:MAG: tetratricopeptide repeat protein [Candidatus Auribacterota bacterium]|jgi:pentatricopeptide repeat protein|nr:tetratricopeptide repeat protein [Candidatus Auribacterota bacterium]
MIDSTQRRTLFRKTAFFLLTGVMIALRFIYLVQARHDPGFDQFLFPDDQEYYYRMASRIADGNLTGNSGNLMRGPGYMYFLAMLFAISGKSIVFVKGVQALLGVLSGVCLYHIGKRLFGAFTGLAALAFYAFYLPILSYESTLLMESLVTFLITCGLLLFYNATDGNRRIMFCASGFMFGWAFTCRPNNILLAFVLLLYLLVTARKTAIFPLLFFTAGMLIAVLPLIMRNFFAGGDLLCVTTQGKLVLINSHFHDCPGIGWYRSAFEEKILLKSRGSMWGVISILSDDISRNFTSWFIKQIGKIYAYFFGFEFSQFINVYLLRETIPVLRIPSVPYGVLSPLAFLGVYLVLAKKRCRQTLVLFGYTAALTFSVVIFYIIARFRQPAIPLFCLFAGYCAVTVIREPRWRMRSVYIVILGILLLVLNLPGVRKGFEDQFVTQSVYNRGMMYFNKQRFDEAIADFERHIKKQPKSKNTAYFLGRSYQEKGQFRIALKWLNYAVMLGDTTADTMYNIGVCYLESGNYAQAEQYVKQGLKKQQAYPAEYDTLARVYLNLGEPDKALEIWRRMTDIFPNDYRAYYQLGIFYFERNDYEPAEHYLSRAVALNAQLSQAVLQLEQLRGKQYQSPDQKGEKN